MRATEGLGRLTELWREIRELEAAEALLAWDQETCMPARGLEGRARALATLAGLEHEKLVAPELREALESAAAEAEAGSDAAAQVEWARRDIERAVNVPKQLAQEIAETSSRALAAWQEARERSEFELFRPLLERMVELKRTEAEAIDPARSVYDTLLDEHEPGASAAELEPLFAEVREALAPLVAAVAESGVTIDESPARGRFDPEGQRAFGIEVATAMGFDFEAGRLDASAHPFCTGIDRRDVRMTWRWHQDDFRPAFFGIVHETGHGLYEQGLPGQWTGTPLGAAVSLGIHESQSRLWENQVARSLPFWRWALPRFHSYFPDTGVEAPEAMWPALHVVRPSLIRVEADEVTYNLHVAVRFELERAIFSGDLAVADLPAAWNRLYGELLGIEPETDAEGALQDIHWALGAFGYFPTYTLGTLAAAQLYEAARRAIGDLDGVLAAGELGMLLDWLRQTVHCHGRRYDAAELVERATGEPLGSGAFLAHARSFVDEIYAVGG